MSIHTYFSTKCPKTLYNGVFALTLLPRPVFGLKLAFPVYDNVCIKYLIAYLMEDLRNRLLL